MIMKQQDQTLGTISGVVGVLREQASLMGQEMSEQNVWVVGSVLDLFLQDNLPIIYLTQLCSDILLSICVRVFRMLDELDGQIDHTESKLSKANRKLNRFVEENKS
jgi:syntaxin 6